MYPPLTGATVARAGRALLADQQVAGRGDGRGDRRRMVAIGLRQRLEGEAVGDREEVGGDGRRVVAKVEHSLALLDPEDLGQVGADAPEELAQLVPDVGVPAPGAEQLEEEQEGVGFVLER